jgi:H+/Cl- antiporter ClcA
MMFVGALVGAALVLHDNVAVALGIATGLMAMIAAGAFLSARQPSAWRLPVP